MENNKQYWLCLIGGVDMEKLPSGADFPLRWSVRNAFNELFGSDDVCSSGWGINEERYNLLRTLHLKTTDELKQLLNTII